ncbi:alpha/beta hydrolase-fold protein [Gimesia panareensis]|uniref:alpha/beta hydrolase-fold protein n=1 Tax=Gimesia panareensis TaxID=2527978 RepID=UPI00118C403C|nr:alpha/beta hydrolase-fold protein [Gimesia panareensis]QDU53795.1 Putative esterase [Gimesia panareensis]
MMYADFIRARSTLKQVQVRFTMIPQYRSLLLAFSVLVSLFQTAGIFAAQQRFEVRFTKAVHSQPFTGRVYLFFSRSDRDPRLGPSWFHPESFVARDVTDWKPGEVIAFPAETPGLLAYPKPYSEMDLNGYKVQAVARFNVREPKIGTGPGNGFSQVISVPAVIPSKPPLLTIESLVPAKPFPETRWSKLFRVRSELLSKFHGQDTFLEASVLLPQSYYDQPGRKYPVIFSIPGFGGDHLRGIRNQPIAEQNEQGVEFLRVLLNPQCQWGHHVFADSATNGPVGEAFTTEFIPALEKAFRAIPHPRARFLTGHSSGGWSSLWLQITYPDQFGGTWSTAPDPVDFRDFQLINIYEPGSNVYRDAHGRRRPIARRDGKPILWFEPFAKMEHVLGHGGQLRSFEAVFSPRGADGKPLNLYNRETGAVDPQVAEAWKAYDIRLILEENWEKLAPQLGGKIHIFMGDEDTFYLDGATVLLKQTLDRLNGNIAGGTVVEIHPGKTHSSLITNELRLRFRKEMVQSFLAHQAEIESALRANKQ